MSSRGDCAEYCHRDLGNKILLLHATITEIVAHPEMSDYFHDLLEQGLTPDAEKHLQGRLDVYVGLREYDAAAHLYNELRTAVERKQVIMTKPGIILWILGYYLEEGIMRAKLFNKFLSPGKGQRLVDLAATRYAWSKDSAKKDGSLEGSQ